jgi:hypothetical protein
MLHRARSGLAVAPPQQNPFPHDRPTRLLGGYRLEADVTTDNGLYLTPPLSTQGVEIAKRPVLIAHRRRKAKADVNVTLRP